MKISKNLLLRKIPDTYIKTDQLDVTPFNTGVASTS